MTQLLYWGAILASLLMMGGIWRQTSGGERLVLLVSLGVCSLWFAWRIGSRLHRRQRIREHLDQVGHHLAFAYRDQQGRGKGQAGAAARVPGTLWAFPSAEARERYLAAPGGASTARKAAVVLRRLPQGWSPLDAMAYRETS